MTARPRQRSATKTDAHAIATAPCDAAIRDSHAHGQRDGLRLALSVLAAEEAKWAALLGESPSWRTNAIREVRHKTLQVAQTRIRTVLNRLKPKDGGDLDAELAAALEKAGL